MTSYPVPGATASRRSGESGAALKVLALFLGVAVAVMAVVGIVLMTTTLDARSRRPRSTWSSHAR